MECVCLLSAFCVLGPYSRYSIPNVMTCFKNHGEDLCSMLGTTTNQSCGMPCGFSTERKTNRKPTPIFLGPQWPPIVVLRRSAFTLAFSASHVGAWVHQYTFPSINQNYPWNSRCPRSYFVPMSIQCLGRSVGHQR